MDVVPSDKRVQAVCLADTISHVQEMHPEFPLESGKALAKFYFEAVDRKGAWLDLEDAFPIIGYKRKDYAKKQLQHKKLNLVENRDYKIYLRNQPEEKKHGGHGKETILLTSRAFSQLALNAGTDNSIALRDFFQFLMMHFKDLLLKLQNGTLKLVEGDGSSYATEDTRVKRRIVAAETQKTLTGVMKDLGFKKPYMYAMVNSATNLAVTGRTKKQVVDELNKRGVKRRRRTKDKNGKTIVPRQQSTVKNTTVRNVMTTDHLGINSTAERASAAEMSNLKNPTFEEALEVHNYVVKNALGPSLKKFLHNQPMEVKMMSSSKADKMQKKLEGPKSNVVEDKKQKEKVKVIEVN